MMLCHCSILQTIDLVKVRSFTCGSAFICLQKSWTAVVVFFSAGVWQDEKFNCQAKL